MTPLVTISARAYAKVNLALAVSPPEPVGSARPGWHRIASWFACVELWDEVIVTPAGETRYEIAWASDAPRPSPIDWPIEKDLGVRAHRALETHAGRALPVHLRVNKRIPVGGGLGGGSADAAAVLRAVNAACGLGLVERELHSISATLGSDVAFFLDTSVALDEPARPAIVEGFGDRLERVAAVSAHLVLLFPEFGCPTADVYRAFDGLSPGAMRDERVRVMHADAAARGAIRIEDLFNDLAEPAERVRPALAEIRSSLAYALRTPVHVTGSGSTMFVVVANAEHARAVAETSRRVAPSVAAVATRLV